MLAARARGLGTAWTNVDPFHQRDANEVLGIAHPEVTQAALIPVAFTIGDEFTPGARLPLETFVSWQSCDGGASG
jgi:nitroreductase